MTGLTDLQVSRDEVFATLAALIDNSDGELRSNRLRKFEVLFPAMPPLDEPSDFMMSVADLRALHASGMTIGG